MGRLSMRARYQRAVAPLRSRSFVRFLVASRINTVGNTMATGAIAFAVLGSGGGARGIATVMAAEMVTTIVLAPVLGTAADRLPRIRSIACAGSAVTLLLAVEAALVHAGRGTTANLAVTGALVSAAGALSGGASNGVARDLVAPEQRPAANAVNRLTMYGIRTAGPALGGTLVATAGPAAGLALNAAFTGASVLVLWGVDAPHLLRERAGFRTDVRAGVRAITGTVWLWTYIAAGAVTVPLWQLAFFVLGPPHAAAHFGGAAAWGWITASFGGGMAAGALVSLLTQPRRAMWVTCAGSAALALPPAALAVRAPLAAVMAAAAVGAGGLSLAAVAWRSAIQQHVPAELQGRVGTYADTAQVALTPAAFILVGPILSVLGPSTTQTLCAAVIAAASLAPLLLRRVRQVTLLSGNAP